MIFENTFFSSTLCVMLCSFIVGFLIFLIFGIVMWKKNPQQCKDVSKIRLAALVCGLTTSFFLSIVICTLTPSLITVEDDLSYRTEYSFLSNGKFIGIGGSYIANNSNRKLRLVGIGEDQDIDVVISPMSIKKVRKCPEAYFREVPDQQYVSVTTTRRGKRKVIRGISVYLVEF